MFELRAETAADAPLIEDLLDRAFGLDRKAKTSYRFRRSAPPVAALSRVAWSGDRLVGTIRYWPIGIGGTPALLLGPLGVEPGWRGLGIGRALVRQTRAELRADDPYALLLLVGDPAYYRPLGFAQAPMTIVMAGEDPRRLMIDPGAARIPTGIVTSIDARSKVGVAGHAALS